MKDQTVWAYARAYEVAKRAIEREGGHVTEAEDLNSLRQPQRIFAQLYNKASMMGALNDYDEGLIRHYLDEATETPELDEVVNPSQQQIMIWAAMDWHNLTPAQAAEELGITEQRVRQLIQSRLLDAVKIKGKWFVSGKSVRRRKATMR